MPTRLDGRLDRKTAVVTGAGRGIGRATAELLATEGARVLASDVDEEALAETVSDIAAAGGVARALAGDVTAPDFPRRLPLTVDFSTGFYFHREGEALVLGGREQSLDELAPIAVRRVPSLETIGVRSSWWGYYEMSPDHNAIVGATGVPSGLFYATGFSGHGFQQGPVIGEHLAELALGREPTFDLEPFSLSRFARGRERIEHHLV